MSGYRDQSAVLRNEAIKARALDISKERDTATFSDGLSDLIEAAIQHERKSIAEWLRSENEVSECGPFALHAASHSVEDGSYECRAAQGIETEGKDREDGLGAKHESPVAEGDAPDPKSVSDSYRDGVERIISKWEAGLNHDEEHFNPDCQTCLILADLRSLVVKPSGSDHG